MSPPLLTDFSLPAHRALEDDFKRSHVRGIIDLLAKSFPEAPLAKWNVRVSTDRAPGLFDVIVHAPLDGYHTILMTMPDGNREGSTHGILAKQLLGGEGQRIDYYCDMNLDNNVWSDFIGWVSMARAQYDQVRFPRRFIVMTTFVAHQNDAVWKDYTPGMGIELFAWPEKVYVRVYDPMKAGDWFDPDLGGWYRVGEAGDHRDIIQRGWVVPFEGWADHHLIPEQRKAQP